MSVDAVIDSSDYVWQEYADEKMDNQGVVRVAGK
jgi:hypothetical protein